MSDFLNDQRDLLRRTPQVLRALLAGLPASWTDTPDVGEGWRPRDVLGHLISGELVRAQSLARLGELVADADLDRQGRHPALGEVTLRELLATWAVHDLDHVAQVFAGLAGSHDADVGPWKAYLGILLRRDDPAAVPG